MNNIPYLSKCHMSSSVSSSPPLKKGANVFKYMCHIAIY